MNPQTIVLACVALCVFVGVLILAFATSNEMVKRIALAVALIDLIVSIVTLSGPVIQEFAEIIKIPSTDHATKTKVQMEIDAFLPLAQFYDETHLSDIKIAPLAYDSPNEMEFTRPAEHLSETQREKILVHMYKMMKIHDDGSRFKDCIATVERVRYYLEECKVTSIYVRCALSAPDSTDPTKRIDKGYASCTFQVANPDYEETRKNILDARRCIKQKLADAGTALPSHLAGSGSPSTSTSEDVEYISFPPSSEGFTFEPLKEEPPLNGDEHTFPKFRSKLPNANPIIN